MCCPFYNYCTSTYILNRVHLMHKHTFYLVWNILIYIYIFYISTIFYCPCYFIITSPDEYYKPLHFFSSQPLWLFFFSSFHQKVYLNCMACINVPILYFLPLEPLYRYVIIRVYFHCYFNILSKADFFFHATHTSHYSFI